MVLICIASVFLSDTIKGIILDRKLLQYKVEASAVLKLVAQKIS